MSTRTRKQTKTKKDIKTKTPVCFFCDKTGKIKAFTKNTLAKCRKTMELRKRLKHCAFQLPKSLNQKGYHIPCYNNFITTKNYEIDCLTDPTQKEKQGQIFEDTSTTNTEQNSAEISMPKPIEVPRFKVELEENLGVSETDLNTQNIKKEFIENQFSTFTNYLDPDISKSVILKSILTRKSPIKKCMTQNSFAYSYEFSNQANSNFIAENLQPKIVCATSQVTKGVCIFCNKEVRKIGLKKEFAMKSKEDVHEKVLSWANQLYDYDLIENFKSTPSFLFHALCKIEYRYKIEKSTIKLYDDVDGNVLKILHAEAFNSLSAFINDNIIDNYKTYFLTDLHEHYMSLLFEIQNSATPFNFDSYTPHKLEKEIMNAYYGSIEITTSKTYRKKVVYNIESKGNFDSDMEKNDDLKYEKLAFELRMAIKRHSSSENENDIPEKLLKFVGSLIKGPDVRRTNSTEDYVRIKSICKEVMAQAMKED